MHHRLRNLCQTVLSLIRIAARSSSRAGRDDLLFVQGFVEALACAHGLAFAPAEDDGVYLDELVTEILRLRARAHRLSAGAVTTECSGERVRLGLDQATALGMWLTAAFPWPACVQRAPEGAIAVSIKVRRRRVTVHLSTRINRANVTGRVDELLRNAFGEQLNASIPRRLRAGVLAITFTT